MYKNVACFRSISAPCVPSAFSPVPGPYLNPQYLDHSFGQQADPQGRESTSSVLTSPGSPPVFFSPTREFLVPGFTGLDAFCKVLEANRGCLVSTPAGSREDIQEQYDRCNAELALLRADLEAPKYAFLFNCEDRDWRECVSSGSQVFLNSTHLIAAMNANKSKDFITLLCAGAVLEMDCCKAGSPLMLAAIKHLLLPPVLRFVYLTDLRRSLEMGLRVLDEREADSERKRLESERNAKDPPYVNADMGLW